MVSWRLPDGWPEAPIDPALARFGLGARLAAIAGLVPHGRSVADIGTDHGLLPIALVGSGRCPRAIAIDRNAEPLARAAANAARLGVQVELRQADGLALAPGEVQVAVMAGIGERSIRAITRARAPAELGLERLVLQPGTGFEEVRTALASMGYPSVEERFVADGDRFFLIIAAEPGPPRALSLEAAFLGAVRDDPLFPAWAALQRAHWSRKRASPEAAARLSALSRSSAGS